MKTNCAVLVAGFLFLLAVPANADSVTIAFSGSVNMTFFGGPASSTFSGTATWDTAALPFSSSPPQFGVYKLTGATFFVNGVNHSASIDLSDHGGDPNADSNLAVNNGAASDGVFVTLFYAPGIDLGAGPDLVTFVGRSFGPTTMFSSTAVPQNLNFVPLLDPGLSFFNPFAGPTGTVTFASSVPETSSVLFIASGILVGLLAFKKKTIYSHLKSPR